MIWDVLEVDQWNSFYSMIFPNTKITSFSITTRTEKWKFLKTSFEFVFWWISNLLSVKVQSSNLYQYNSTSEISSSRKCPVIAILTVASMLMTDVGNQMYWWQVWDVGDRFRMLVTDLIHRENHQHNEKSRQHNDSATNIWNQSPS